MLILTGDADAGASGAAFSRWSVGMIITPRAIVPTLRRGNAAGNAPALRNTQLV
jgi:hypothetical protein